jgi:hypothetical protein
VEILLAVRRFFCTAPGCRRKTFAKQIDGLITRYARKTPLLAGVLGRIAVALAGRAGSRLASGLDVPRPGRSCCGWSWPPRTPLRRRHRGCSGSTYPASSATRP